MSIKERVQQFSRLITLLLGKGLQQYIASLSHSHINKMIVLSITKNTLIFNILVQTYKHCTRREQLA